MVIRPDVACVADALAPEIGREREYRLVGDFGARTDAGRSRGQLQPCEDLLFVDQVVLAVNSSTSRTNFGSVRIVPTLWPPEPGMVPSW